MTELCLQEINTVDDDEDKLEKKIIWYVWGEQFEGRDFLQYKLKILSVLLYQVVGMIQCFSGKIILLSAVFLNYF